MCRAMIKFRKFRLRTPVDSGGARRSGPQTGDTAVKTTSDLIDIFENDPNFKGIMKRLFRIALDHSFTAVMITEAGAGYPIIYVNPAFRDLTGYEPQEVIGRSPSLLQGPGTDRSVLERLGRDIRAGRLFHGQALNYRKDGSEFMMEWKIAPVTDEDGRITHYMALQRDVSPNSGR
jgi:PAS domain S-box-containing protein